MEAEQLIHKIATKEDVKSFLIQVLEAFQNMDYHKLNDLLNEEAYYEDMKKLPSSTNKWKSLKSFVKKETLIFLYLQIFAQAVCVANLFLCLLAITLVLNMQYMYSLLMVK